METAARDGGAGHPPKHFDGADGVTTENGKHQRREYDNVASEALKRGLASAEPVEGEDGQGATNHSAGQTREEEREENPKRVSSAQEEPDGGETEESPTPKTVACAKSERPPRGGRGRGNTHPAARAHVAHRGHGGYP